MADRDEAPPITACKLYEKTSKAGNIYLTGRLGGLRVLIFKTRELADDGIDIANEGPSQPIEDLDDF